MKFKIGDRVRLTRDSSNKDWAELKRGEIGKIVKINGCLIMVANEKGKTKINIDGLEFTKPQTLKDLIE